MSGLLSASTAVSQELFSLPLVPGPQGVGMHAFVFNVPDCPRISLIR
jgi:hypothetical protein